MTDEPAGVPAGDPPGDPAGDCAARLYITLGRLVRVLRQQTADATPVGPGGLSALSTLSRTGPLRLSALAQTEGISAPSLTRIVNVLERQGLAQRAPDPADGRAQLVDLTPAGVALIASGLEARMAALRERLMALTDEERADVEAALPALERICATR